MLRGEEDREMLRPVLRRMLAAAALLVAYVAFSAWKSAGLEISRTMLPVRSLSQGLNGLRIVQITDLHSSQYGENQSELIDPIAAFRPDLIVLTGDIIDGHRPIDEPCEQLVKGLAAIAPVYRITGNHEYYRVEEKPAFDALMGRCGAKLLSNQSVVLEKNGCRYLLSGMEDVQRRNDKAREKELGGERYEYETASQYEDAIRASLPAGSFSLKIMLSHRPYFWGLWARDGYDIALTGHLHGLQLRIPGVGGVSLHPSRYFPEASAGLYDKGGVQVYISRGLDRRSALWGLRMNNQPELAFFTVVAK